MGFAKDLNGWYVPTPSASSKIYYVSNVDGNDGTAKQWTAADPNYDTVIGPDPRNPLQPANVLPYANLGAAYGVFKWGDSTNPDAPEANWLLLKRGEVWPTSGASFANNWPTYCHGISGTERAVITTYGPSQARPRIDSNTGITPIDLKRAVANFAIIGIDFYAYYNDPTDLSWAGVVTGQAINVADEDNDLSAFGPHGNFLVEDCKARFYGKALSVQMKSTSVAGGQYNNIECRRNVFVDNWGIAYYQGSGAASVLIEENVFDGNGWYYQGGESARDDGGIAGGDGVASVFSHNIYFDNENPENLWSSGGTAISTRNVGDRRGDFICRGNVLGNAASHAVQWRCGGTMELNLCGGNPIGLQLGGGDGDSDYLYKNPQGVWGDVRFNVIETTNDINTTLRRGVGIKVYNTRLQGMMEFRWNLLNRTMTGGSQVNAKNIQNDGDNGPWIIEDNVSYDHPRGGINAGIPSGTSEERNKWWDMTVTGTNEKSENVVFADPTRTIGKYNVMLGGTDDYKAFINECRNQSYFNWRTEYTAEVACTWILAGFGIYVEGGNPVTGLGLVRTRAKPKGV